MTLPYERTRAVTATEQFLLDLCDPKTTPRVSSVIRKRAKSLLRHYPTRYEMELVSDREQNTAELGKMIIQIFGRMP